MNANAVNPSTHNPQTFLELELSQLERNYQSHPARRREKVRSEREPIIGLIERLKLIALDDPLGPNSVCDFEETAEEAMHKLRLLLAGVRS